MDELIDRVGWGSRGWWRLKEIIGWSRGVHIVVHVQIKSAKVCDINTNYDGSACLRIVYVQISA